ncbi:MAG: hypothetical protein ACTS73_00285 [Arsenophonus sp. NEOnobi-MAG3]
MAEEDLLLFKTDNLFAYNLLIIIDDHEKGITKIVRSADLIAPTAVRQIFLYLYPIFQKLIICIYL